MKTLYLYGAPGSGKTTTAKRLAREFGRDYVDLDAVVVERLGMSIAECFARFGEARFRAEESAALREVDSPVVALGGGTLLDERNRAYCEERGMVVVLDVDLATLAERVALGGDTRPLGDRARERRGHYASFRYHADGDSVILLPRRLRGEIRVPPSKSHLHRLLIAEFLAADGATGEWAVDRPEDCEDILATRRSLRALASARAAKAGTATLDVGESGSTLRFLAPLAAALGVRSEFVRRGRLAERPFIAYERLSSGVHELEGNVSSQFVTGLLFALPLLAGDSEIRFTSPLESRGYVELTLSVLREYGVAVETTADGYRVRGGQRYRRPAVAPAVEGDWSAAAFWYAANALGSELTVTGLKADSCQPDRAVAELLAPGSPPRESVDVSGFPDLYPALVVSGRFAGFTGTERLRLKESDRIAAMAAVMAAPEYVDSRNDHRIAMAAAVLSTIADSPTVIRGAGAVRKSYPRFWEEFRQDLYAVTGWPLAATRSPEIHNAAFAAAGVRAEFVASPRPTAAAALAYAERCGVKGMAVTIPHKETIIPLLDEVDGFARGIGAVNTVRFVGGRRIGYNTDAPGFLEAIRAFLGGEALAGLAVALLGDGGAAKAVRFALESAGARVEVFHRRPLEAGYRLIVNATPVDPIPDYRFTGDELVYDLRYVPAETPLMARARSAGCRVENGFSMLEAQARRQREIWEVPGDREAAEPRLD